MAQTYFQFSFSIPLRTKKERKWFESFMAEKNDEYWSKDQIEDYPDIGDRPGSLDFEFDKGDIIIFAEESGDTEQAIGIIKAFLRDSGTKLDRVGFSYAYTCSSMRPGNFGGGAIMVKRSGKGFSVDYIDASDWLATEG